MLIYRHIRFNVVETATATRDILDPTPQRFSHRNLRKTNDTYTLLGYDPEV